MTAIIVDLQGARPMGDVGQLAALAEGGAVFWLDVSGGETEAQALPLGKLGFEATDVAWAMRFGQGGRMNVARGRLRWRPGWRHRAAAWSRSISCAAAIAC